MLLFNWFAYLMHMVKVNVFIIQECMHYSIFDTFLIFLFFPPFLYRRFFFPNHTVHLFHTCLLLYVYLITGSEYVCCIQMLVVGRERFLACEHVQYIMWGCLYKKECDKRGAERKVNVKRKQISNVEDQKTES